MTHEQLQDRLIDLAYGELTGRDARDVQEHVGACETCRAELARIGETRRLMSALPVEPAPPGRERILLAAAREAARRREPRRMLPRWLWGGSIVAASLAAVVAVSYRVVSMRPGSLGREDPNALMGQSPSAPPPRAEEEQATPVEPKARSSEGDPFLGAGPRGNAPEPAREPPARRPRRFASPPPAVEEPPPAEETRKAARLADRAPPDVAFREQPGRTDREEAHTDTARDSAAPAASAAAPPRSRAMAPAPHAAAKAAAPEAAGAASRVSSGDAADDAVARRDALRRAGRLRTEVRTFPGCDGELWRRVERDPDGRAVSYAREALLGGRRVRIEVIYRADGAPAQVRVLDAASSAPIPGPSPWVPAAGDVDGPPRCEP
jgi:hypothetical protein